MIERVRGIPTCGLQATRLQIQKRGGLACQPIPLPFIGGAVDLEFAPIVEYFQFREGQFDVDSVGGDLKGHELWVGSHVVDARDVTPEDRVVVHLERGHDLFREDLRHMLGRRMRFAPLLLEPGTPASACYESERLMRVYSGTEALPSFRLDILGWRIAEEDVAELLAAGEAAGKPIVTIDGDALVRTARRALEESRP